jgi:carboxyl-terminal processing protease
VSTRSRIQAENRVYRADDGPKVDRHIGIVVLIDKYTASAAEILTGALKDTGRATVMGETSYGKGSVQQIVPVNGGGLRLTTSKYYTPSGTSIDNVGIEPDIVISQKEFTEEEIESYRQMAESGAIAEFVRDNPEPSEQEIQQFIGDLRDQGIVLRERRIRREIKNEVNRLTGRQMVYDLEYDTVLSRAVEWLRTN